MKLNRYIIVTLTLSVILLIVAFSWNEKVDFNYKINDQKIANFFVCVFTIIGTIATIFYSIKQYKLSELVNRTSIKPDLFPKSYTFQMVDDENPVEISYLKRNLYLTHAMGLDDDQGLLIENIGVGVAKTVNYKWIFNTSEVMELIKGTYYLTPNGTRKVIEYLEPTKSISISLPIEYLSCYGPKLLNKFETKFFSNEDTLNLPRHSGIIKTEMTEWVEATYPKTRPELFLELTYKDSQDFQYKKIFKTKVSGIHNFVLFEFYRT